MDLTHFENCRNFFNQKGLPDVYALVLYSQAVVETGRFTSNIYQVAKNAFGMRPNSRKMYVSIYHSPTNGNFCVYADVQTSFLDRIALDAQNGIMPVSNINDIQAYIRSVIAKGYVGDNQSEQTAYFEAWFNVVRATLEANRSLIFSDPNEELLALESLNDQLDAYNDTKGTRKWLLWVVGAVVGFFAVKWFKNRKK